jgi:Zn-dependent protease with chaperone function
MLVYPHLVALMKLQDGMPRRAGCPIGFAVLDTSALNAWVSVRAEPMKPAAPVRPVGETREVRSSDQSPSPPPQCRQFSLTVTSGVLALPPEELRAVVAHDLGHVYLGHIHAARNAQIRRLVAEILIVGIIPTLMMHAETYPFMTTFSQSQEADADRFAVDLLIRSGSSCGALAVVFERFQQAQERSSTVKFEWLSSHPSPERRIETVRDLCANHAG